MPEDLLTGQGELVIHAARYDHPDTVELTQQVQSFYRSVYGGIDDSPITAQDFQPPQGQFLLGYLYGQAVAMGGWRTLSAGLDGAERPVELKRMFVRPEQQGRGFGLQILQALERSAAGAGADWVVLETGRPQVRAVQLYRAAGYREVAPFGYFACMPLSMHLGRPLDRA